MAVLQESCEDLGIGMEKVKVEAVEMGKQSNEYGTYDKLEDEEFAGFNIRQFCREITIYLGNCSS